MNEIIVRAASSKDGELIAEMSRQTFHDSFASQNTKDDMDKFMNEQFSREKLIKEVEEPGSLFFLAWIEGQPVGYMRMRDGERYPEFGNFSSIEIARIYAVQAAIGKGVGSALIKMCLEVAKERERELIWLGVWEHNQRAINFYKKWGFEKFGDHEFVLGNDVQSDWLMKKKIM